MMRGSIRVRAIWMTLLIVVAVLSGCASSKKTSVTLQLDWIPFGRHAPYYVALEKGYYKEAGLEVTVRPGTGVGQAFQALATKQAEFTFNDIGYMVSVMAQEKVPLQAVSVIYSRAPHTVFFFQDSGIKTPKDLEGKTIAFSAGSSPYLIFDVFAKANGVDPTKVKWVQMEPNALNTAFLTHKVDALVTYVLTLPVLQQNAKPGEAIGTFMFGDYQVPILNSGIIVRKEYADANPDLVKGFTQATMKGVRYALDHPEEAMEIMAKQHPQIDKQIGVKELALIKQLAETPEAKQNTLGWIDAGRMKTTVDVMAGVFKLPNDFNVDDMFTNKYLK